MQTRNADQKCFVGDIKDEKFFRSLSYKDQWRALIRDLIMKGDRDNFPFMMVHWVLNAIILFIWYMTMSADASLESWAIHYTVVYYLFALLGMTGMNQGPLSGEPKFRLTRYRFKVGSYREPLFSFFGRKRTIFDVLLYIVTILCTVRLLTVDLPTPTMYSMFYVCVLLQLATDQACFIGSDGYILLPVTTCFFFRYCVAAPGTIAALQIFLTTLYVSCGLGKMGPWFRFVFSVEWTCPPWASGNKFLRNLFFVDADAENYAITPFGTMLAWVAASTEWVAPLLMVVFAGTAVATMCACTLIAMHIYIIVHLPLADVTQLNLYPAFLLYWCSLDGFNWADFAHTHWALKGAAVGLIGRAVLGHFRTDSISYFWAYRFWAGNWPTAFVIVSDSGAQKLAHRLSHVDGDLWVRDLVPSMITEHEARVIELRNVAKTWMTQLDARVMPALFQLAKPGIKLDQQIILYSMFFIQYVIGINCNCALRTDFAMACAQEACKFEEGELISVEVNSFAPSWWSDSTNWKITDACKGKIASGTVSWKDCAASSKPDINIAYSKQ